MYQWSCGTGFSLGMSACDVYRRMKELVDGESDCLNSESVADAERISEKGLDVGVRLKEISLQTDNLVDHSTPVAHRKLAWVKLPGGCFGIKLIQSGELLILKQSDSGYRLYLRSKENRFLKERATFEPLVGRSSYRYMNFWRFSHGSSLTFIII